MKTNNSSNPLQLSRKEFEEYKTKNKYVNKPYEFYRVYPLLNHKHQGELTIFVRTNQNPIDIMKEATKLLEEEMKDTQ